MKSWPVQNAKNKFSELLETCLTEGPQLVTKHGVATAVVVPAQEWQRLQTAARPSLKDLLLATEARTDFLVPARGRARRRQTTALGE